MDPVDGNAIGGLLLEVFGVEMTAAPTVCGSCGAVGRVGELAVYAQAPGTIVRCRSCGSVLMAFVRARDRICVDLLGLSEFKEQF